MQGRLENEIKNNNKIAELLIDMPKEVKEYYNSIRIGLESSTCLEYVRKIKHFLLKINKELNDITSEDVSNYISDLMYYEKNNEIKKVSYSYIKSILTILNKFFVYLQSKNKINENPISSIVRPKVKDDVHRFSLSFEQLNDILSCSKTGTKSNKRAKSLQKKWSSRDYAILYLFMVTGMRRTALSEINISDISFSNNILKITDKRNKKFEYEITPETKEVLMAWIVERNKILKDSNEDALFISNQKKRICVREIQNITYKYSEEALGFSVSPHKFRGSFITLCYENNGYDLEATAKAVGHENINTTLLYINQNNKPRKQAAEFMSSNLK